MASDPAQIGPYRIVEVLGEGGMGMVYLAEQTEPVKRRVALKVLKPHADSERVLARFEAERQALAVMDHPSIAKIFDAGVTDDGRSYFAMERVEGIPIGAFCDQARLTVRERARLYVDVCAAVQHAHQKGVIHRDLKPSNILVSEVDGKPHPRIIDFGIAKATGTAGFDGTQLTVDDHVVGTPAYMSPEQLDGSRDVDTRADIYALGVLLYELMLGVLPFDNAAYRGWAAVAAALHRDPPSPVRRFTELADTQETLAGRRSTTPALLRRELAGDIGWIVGCAMEKDRDRRYETANAFGLDLQRYLDHEPVRARGASTVYRMRKFARRNRIAVAFAATVVAGLAAFSVVTSVQAERIARARDEAEARRDQAEGLIDFMLSDLREKLEPIGRLEILDDVGEQATRYFATIPEEQLTDNELASRSQALYQIGSVRLNQGESADAVGAFEESLRLARALSARAPDDPDRLFGLSQSHFYVGYASWLAEDLDVAEEQFLGYLAAAERLVELDPENLDYRLELGFAHGNLGSVREERGDLDGAIESYALTLDAKRALVDRDSTQIDWIGELAETHNKLGVVHAKQGDYTRALDAHEREMELKQRILVTAPEHAYWRYRLAWGINYLADLRQATGALDIALDLRMRQVAILDSLVGHDLTNVRWRRALAIAERGRAELLDRLGRTAEARGALARALEAVASLHEADPDDAGHRGDLAWVRATEAQLALEAGRVSEAHAAAAAAVGLLDSAGGSTTSGAEMLAWALLLRGRALDLLGRHEEGTTDWERALATLDAYPGQADRNPFRPLRAELLLRLGRTAEAAPQLRTLAAQGYVDTRLTALARRRGIED